MEEAGGGAEVAALAAAAAGRLSLEPRDESMAAKRCQVEFTKKLHTMSTRHQEPIACQDACITK